MKWMWPKSLIPTWKSGMNKQIVLLVLALLSMLCIGIASEATDSSPAEECDNPETSRGGVRMVTREELSTQNGKDGTDIWLSILGEVYDVSSGTDFYATGASYGAFAGRDATVPFCTGKFTDEEAEKDPEVLGGSELVGLADWRDFYKDHKDYKFVGYLFDPRYYDENGQATEQLTALDSRIVTAKLEQAQKALERRMKRDQAKQQKAKEKAKS